MAGVLGVGSRLWVWHLPGLESREAWALGHQTRALAECLGPTHFGSRVGLLPLTSSGGGQSAL